MIMQNHTAILPKERSCCRDFVRSIFCDATLIGRTVQCDHIAHKKSQGSARLLHIRPMEKQNIEPLRRLIVSLSHILTPRQFAFCSSEFLHADWKSRINFLVSSEFTCDFNYAMWMARLKEQRNLLIISHQILNCAGLCISTLFFFYHHNRLSHVAFPGLGFWAF
jgi:hypothetical protein